MWQLQACNSDYPESGWDVIYTGSRARCEALIASVQDMRCYDRIRLVPVSRSGRTGSRHGG